MRGCQVCLAVVKCGMCLSLCEASDRETLFKLVQRVCRFISQSFPYEDDQFHSVLPFPKSEPLVLPFKALLDQRRRYFVHDSPSGPVVLLVMYIIILCRFNGSSQSS